MSIDLDINPQLAGLQKSASAEKSSLLGPRQMDSDALDPLAGSTKPQLESSSSFQAGSFKIVALSNYSVCVCCQTKTMKRNRILYLFPRLAS